MYCILPNSCPGLIMLDLTSSVLRKYDTARFTKLMQSLKTGLRCLMLPAVQFFTPTELQSIFEYHGHSLRCLRIIDLINITDRSVSDLVNNLPHLHTLSLGCKILPLLAQKKITNKSITHLIVSHIYHETCVLHHITAHFPAMTKLSLGCFGRDTSIINDVTKFLSQRRMIHTVCVDKEDIVKQLRIVLPQIVVLHGDSFDLFANQY